MSTARPVRHPVDRPADLDTALERLDGTGARPRAGGTDVTSCVDSGVLAPAPVVDLTGVRELHGTRWHEDGSVSIGALSTVAAVAADPDLAGSYPGLAETARALATPQVRAAGTVAGNLLQRNRCVYLRNPAFDCLQTGGQGCPARHGDHLHGVAVDQSGCVAPHPSSLAMALMAHDASVRVVSAPGGARSGPGDERPVAQLYDAADPTRDHVVGPQEVVVSVSLAPPAPRERAAYMRATGRSRAEWPLVEAVARLGCQEGDTGPVVSAAVAVGGVARTPLRLPEVEAALVGAVPGTPPESGLDRALESVADLCSPLPATGYKVDLLRATVRDVVERALALPFPAARRQ